jgi:hypothetical protein
LAEEKTLDQQLFVALPSTRQARFLMLRD